MSALGRCSGVPGCAVTSFSRPGRGFAVAGADRLSRVDVQFMELKQQLGHTGVVNHKKLGVLSLYRMMKDAYRPKEFKLALQAMNHFYNFGIKLKHRELSSRLLAAAMCCKVQDEAVELIKLYGTWLEKPPDQALVYAVMGHFLDAGQPLVVREIARAVREDWRMAVGPPLYTLSIEAMLRLEVQGDGPQPLEEAFQLYEDAATMGVRLPAPLHVRLLDRCLEAFEEVSQSSQPSAEADETAEADRAADGADEASSSSSSAEPQALTEEARRCLTRGVQAANGLAHDGHLRGGANAASLCSVAWLFWHLGALPSALRNDIATGEAVNYLGGDWCRTLTAALEGFGTRGGFSAKLPRGFFAALEASDAADATRMIKVCQVYLDRFYPAGEDHRASEE